MSASEIPADQTKKEAITEVINDTGRGTKDKTVKWTSEALRAAQEDDVEIKPILEWKEPIRNHLKKGGNGARICDEVLYPTVRQVTSDGRCLIPTMGE